MKDPFLLLKVPLKRFSIQKDRLDFPSRGKGKKLLQGLSLEGHLDGCFSGSSKRVLNLGPDRVPRGEARLLLWEQL